MSVDSPYYTSIDGPLHQEAGALRATVNRAVGINAQCFAMNSTDLNLLDKIFQDFAQLDKEHTILRGEHVKKIAEMKRANRRLELALRSEKRVRRGVYFGSGIALAILAVIAFFLVMSALGVATTPMPVSKSPTPISGSVSSAQGVNF